MKSIPWSFARGLAVVSWSVVLVGCSGGEPDLFGAHREIDLGQQRAELKALDREADLEALAKIATVAFKDACPASPGTMRCHAKIVMDANGEEIATAAPTAGLFPADLRDAYKLPATGGNGRLVAIVDGFDAPTAEADMNMYRAQFGIPPCTTANGCFKKVNTAGTEGPYPPFDAGWATEIAVDLDMVSATCPDCKILLVEAATGFAVDLGPAVATAARLGAFDINNSYGEPEDDLTSKMVEADYNNAAKTALVVASSGDNGYGRSTADNLMVVNQIANPANLTTVMSVGGTTLTKSTSARGWAETTWRGSGSGCSSHIAKPAWQKDTGCTMRTVADISAVGDPATGAAYVNNGLWRVVGGTSISSPIVAGIFALLNVNSVSWPYEHPASFFDVIRGSNGSCGNYQCDAGVGYDGPTGLGTPNGALFGPTVPPEDGGAGPATGVGGAGGAGSVGGAGGVGTGQGGATGTSGTAGAGGFPGSTGAGGSTGTTSGTGTGTGTASTTGTGSTSTGGTTTGAVAPTPDSGNGCSCRIDAGQRAGSRTDLAALLVIGLGAVVGARRRARRSVLG